MPNQVTPRRVVELYDPDAPAVYPLVTAGEYFGLGRNATYEAASSNQFPVPVLRLGHNLKVTRASLLQVLDPSGSADPHRTASSRRSVR